MKNIYLFQPQYSIEVRNETNYWLPYSVGCLWSYVSQFPRITDEFTLAGIFFKREKIQHVVDQLDNPTLCGFSCYLWNENYCLALAEKIKTRWPDCIILFGGPQVTEKTLDLWFVDSVISGEGEEPFLSILDSILNGEPYGTNFSRARLQDLNIPSPYLTGVFDTIIEDNPSVVWAATLETTRGCPYQCTFCDWGSATYSKLKKFNLEKIAAELDWCTRYNVEYIFVADANFGILKERDLEIAKLIREAADRSKLQSINLQYAKNSTDIIFEIAKTVGPYGKGITVSVQSMNDTTLDNIKRKNLDINNIERVMRLSHEHDVSTYTEVILGLPNETLDSWKSGLAQLLELGQHQNIDVWFSQLLRNSEMATPFSRKLYGLKTVFVEDYLLLGKEEDDDSGIIKEHNEVVNETKTMTLDDMVEAYMYAWMIIHFHINGFTQLIARYARTVQGIPYRVFYDSLFAQIQRDPMLNEFYVDLRGATKNYLSKGKLPEHFLKLVRGGHALHMASYEPMYDNRQYINNVACNVLANVMSAEYPESIQQLQEAFLFDINASYPKDIVTDYNIYSGAKETTHYRFKNQTDDVIESFYLLRRKGLLKNKVSIL